MRWSQDYAEVEDCLPGHHEAEFGMQWCAGFSGAFWEAYHEIIPRAPGVDSAV